MISRELKSRFLKMENKIKIILFVIFVGYIVLGLIIKIPSILNNIIYGAMALVSIFFLVTNKKELGLTNIFKKEEKEEK